MESTKSNNLDLLESEIRSIVEANKEFIQKIENLKQNQNKFLKSYHVIKFKNPDFSKIKDPLSIISEKINEEEFFSDYINNWATPSYIEKPEEVDSDKLLYGENKELMNMKCENFEDLIRINQQISVAAKYLTLLRESASYAFGLKFKKNFERVGQFLKIMLKDLEVKEGNDTKSDEIKGKIQEINKLFLKLFDIDSILNCEPFKLKIETKILTKPLMKMLADMFIVQRKAFKLIHDSVKDTGAANFDAAVKNKSPTLILIKNNLNYIFGAYVFDRWGIAGGWIPGSKENFLFTFGTENNVKPIKLLGNGGNGIHITSCGLHLGSDLVAFCSHTCTPQVYTQIAPGYPNVLVTNTLLAGANRWTPTLMEVFEEIN